MFTYFVVVIIQMLCSVTVGEHQKLRIAVERNVGSEFAGNRCEVFGQTLRFNIRERGTSAVSFRAWVVASTTS